MIKRKINYKDQYASNRLPESPNYELTMTTAWFLAQGLFVSARLLFQLLVRESRGSTFAFKFFWQLSILSFFRFLMVYGTVIGHYIRVVGGQVFGKIISYAEPPITACFGIIPRIRVFIVVIPFVLFWIFFQEFLPFQRLFLIPDWDFIADCGEVCVQCFTGRFFAQWCDASEEKGVSFPKLVFGMIRLLVPWWLLPMRFSERCCCLLWSGISGSVVYGSNISIEKNIKFSISNSYLDRSKS